MASMIPIASQEKFDSISPVRSNGQAINLELEFRGGDDGSDHLQSRHLKQSGDSCATSVAPSCDSGESGGRTSSDDEGDLPSEVAKTALCLVALILVFAANLLSVATISYRTPVTKQDANQTHPPLRDITFDVSLSAPLLQQRQLLLLVAAELAVVATSAYVLGAVIVFHPHRSIVFRRFCFLLALLFGLRLLTMNVTVLPVSSASLYHCVAEQRNLVLGAVGSRFFDLLTHLGLSVDGEIRYCGNYVFNGHAVILVLNCLWVDEYGVPQRRLLSLATKIVAAGSLLSLVVAGYEYTISIITAYYATTRIFWIYHTMANNVSLKRYDPVNQVCKEWWYPVFQYLEGNVRNIVPSSNKFQ
ncbi:hypothetical protein V9T40_009731 [Parthenolecanium corni]|uniref:Sphingomyelin synthase-like domain-containing protein n=1 Tax=Parthenolecanium corni TaxID=536013 RepID=A0AAN9TT23_9HEMI